jgi:hypothetical protein
MKKIRSRSSIRRSRDIGVFYLSSQTSGPPHNPRSALSYSRTAVIETYELPIKIPTAKTSTPPTITWNDDDSSGVSM